MDQFYINLFGYMAGICTTLAFVPQLIQVVKTKSTKDISLLMFVIFTLGVFFWLLYGFFLKALPVIIPNIVIFILASVILGYKIRYK